MDRRARLWTGVTIVAIIVLNYAVIGVPLFRKSQSLAARYKTAVARQLKNGGGIFAGSDDEYLIDIFRRERAAISRNILILNAVSLSALIVIGSWTAFGLVLHKEK